MNLELQNPRYGPADLARSSAFRPVCPVERSMTPRSSVANSAFYTSSHSSCEENAEVKI